MPVSRETLYEEVWAEPMTTVAKRYDVSANYLARICERLGVPRPGRGYWAQRAVGVKVKLLPLPLAEPGAEIEWVRDGSEPRRQPVAIADLVERRSKGAKAGQHPLIRGARADFDKARESRYQTYVRPFKRNLVDVFVSKEMIDKALKVANGLFLTLEESGFRVMLAPSGARFRHIAAEVCEGRTGYQGIFDGPGTWSPAKATVALVGETAFGITVFEVSENVDVRYDSATSKYVRVGPSKAPENRARRALASSLHDWTTRHWLPSGRLGVHAFAAEPNVAWEHYWREGKPGELSRITDDLAKTLSGAVPTIKELVEHHNREAEEQRVKWEAQRREWARQEEERQRVERETRRQKEIAETIANWRMARDLREYVSEVRALVSEAGLKFTKGGKPEEELEWALAYADRVDPVTGWRKNLELAKAEQVGKPCRNCGQVQVATESIESKGDEDDTERSAFGPDD